jgi:hypothetical protein
MNKYALLLAVAAVSAMFSACSEDDKGEAVSFTCEERTESGVLTLCFEFYNIPDDKLEILKAKCEENHSSGIVNIVTYSKCPGGAVKSYTYEATEKGYEGIKLKCFAYKDLPKNIKLNEDCSVDSYSEDLN